MPRSRGPLGLVLSVTMAGAACSSFGATSATPAATELRLGEATLVTEDATYAVTGTDVLIVPLAFTPLDTPAGHVLTGRFTVSEGAVSQPLTLHASAVEPLPRPPTEWHRVLFQLSEAGFVYGGHTATLTVTRVAAAPRP